MIAKPRKFVIDTNVLLSAVAWPHSTPALAFQRALEEGIFLISLQVQAEYAEVFNKPKFDRSISLQARAEFLDAYLDDAVMIVPEVTITDCRHPKDNKFLELALSGNADLILTGDDDLASLNPWRGIPILTPVQYLALPAPNDLP